MLSCLFHFCILTGLPLYLEYSSHFNYYVWHPSPTNLICKTSLSSLTSLDRWPLPCHCPLKANIKWMHYCISLYFCNTVSSDFRLFHENLEGSDDPDLTWRPPLPHWRTGNVPPPTIQRLLPPNTKIPIGIQTSTFPDCFLQSAKIHSLIQGTTNTDCCQQIQKGKVFTESNNKPKDH